MLPFPQLVEQAWVLPEALRQVGSLVQVFEQPVPSPLKSPFGPVHPLGKLVGSVPQSQASPDSFLPLPQAVLLPPVPGPFPPVLPIPEPALPPLDPSAPPVPPVPPPLELDPPVPVLPP